MTISTSDFGKLSSLVDLSDIIDQHASTNASNILDYFVDRGYVIDKSIRAAPYDWRLGAGKV